MKRTLVLFAAAALAGCGGSPHLPVRVEGCNAVPSKTGIAVHATVVSEAYKPVSAVAAVAEFYQDYRYVHALGVAHFVRELDPGQHRRIVLLAAEPAAARISGIALKCVIVHVQYLDGTSADLPAS